jgi:hypothetical protein
VPGEKPHPEAQLPAALGAGARRSCADLVGNGMTQLARGICTKHKSGRFAEVDSNKNSVFIPVRQLR